MAAKRKGDCYTCENIDKSKESMRKKENRKEYERLKKDPHFVDVHYDKKSGGVKATHKGHNEQKEITKLGISSTELEKNCQDILYKKGYRVIFTNENMVDSKGNRLSQLDMMLNGKPCDIASITTNRRHFGETLFKKNGQIERYNNRDDIQIKANSVYLYFHDETMFSYKKVLRSINHYKYRRKNNGELIAHHIKTIYCVIKGKSKDEIITFVVE